MLLAFKLQSPARQRKKLSLEHVTLPLTSKAVSNHHAPLTEMWRTTSIVVVIVQRLFASFCNCSHTFMLKSEIFLYMKKYKQCFYRYLMHNGVLYLGMY